MLIGDWSSDVCSSDLFLQPAGFVQPVLDETRRGAHRPDGVRGTRPDADLVEVEGADGHGAILCCRPPFELFHAMNATSRLQPPLHTIQREPFPLVDQTLASLAAGRAHGCDQAT